MISDIQEKYDQLTQAQKDIFAGYGLRQIKHFVEISLPKVKSVLPEHTQVQGVNAEGKLQAVNAGTQQNYIRISDLQWQLRKVAVMHIDTKEDFQKVSGKFLTLHNTN